MSNDLPFKLETLLEQCGSNAEIAKIILDEFLGQVATDTEELAASLAGGNLEQAGRAGHRLKGSAGVLGAGTLHALCSALENAAKSGNIEDAAQTYADLKAEADRCVAAIPEAKTLL